MPGDRSVATTSAAPRSSSNCAYRPVPQARSSALDPATSGHRASMARCSARINALCGTGG